MFRRPATLMALLALSCAAGATQASIVHADAVSASDGAVHLSGLPTCATRSVPPSLLNALSPEEREYVEWVATAPHDVLVAAFARSVAPTD
jgi:hypothetical protein